MYMNVRACLVTISVFAVFVSLPCTAPTQYKRTRTEAAKLGSISVIYEHGGPVLDGVLTLIDKSHKSSKSFVLDSQIPISGYVILLKNKNKIHVIAHIATRVDVWIYDTTKKRIINKIKGFSTVFFVSYNRESGLLVRREVQQKGSQQEQKTLYDYYLWDINSEKWIKFPYFRGLPK